jgi:hypothetical protein
LSRPLRDNARATAFTVYKALRALALYIFHKHFYVAAKTSHINGSRVNAVALVALVGVIMKLVPKTPGISKKNREITE